MNSRINVPDNNGLFSDTVIRQLTAEKERVIDGEITILESVRSGIDPQNKKFHLKIEAYALSFAYAHNKILSLSNSRTRILAHQVESTHRIVNALNHRFLIADEVGLGKTIEAGLVIKEFIFRHGYRRILIVCPASLQVQWQNEMEEKFFEKFEIIDRRAVHSFRKEKGENANFWDSIEKGIVSIDFIKNPVMLEELSMSHFDAVVIDEAHRLRRDGLTATHAYEAGEILSNSSKAFLLLSATPFRGKLEELYFLVRLVDRNLLGPFQSFVNEYCSPDADLSRLRKKLSEVVIRRTKREVGGFTARRARTIRFELYPEERAFYDATTRYVAEEFNRAKQSQNRAIGFVMTVFQKLLDSSSFALCEALRKRRINLGILLDQAKLLGKANDSWDEFVESVEPELADNEEDRDASGSIIRTVDDIQSEIKTLDLLITLGLEVRRNKKAEKLCAIIESMKERGISKFLIFTQFRTTQEYLLRELSAYRVSLFHGSLDKDQKEDAMNHFREDAEILICTEAGGEGRNMQFCRVLLNYDLPWSPLKIEQRIGRVHRFGQKHDVLVYNFSTRDTVAERVLDVLTHKLHLFEESIGSPDIMLGQIEDEVNFSDLFMEMASGRRSKKSAEAEIDNALERARESFDKLSDLTVARRMDFNYDEYYRVTQKDRSYSNRQLECFILRARECIDEISLMIGTSDGRKLFPIRHIPGVEKHNKYGTFDSEKALLRPDLEFLAFGHPIVDRAIAASRERFFGGETGSLEIEYNRPFEGMVFFYSISFMSESDISELMAVVVDFDNKTFSVELERIERECLRSDSFVPITGEDGIRLSNRCREEADLLFSKARGRIFEKVDSKLWDLRDQLDMALDPEIEKVKESSDKQIIELTSNLERQELAMKCFGRDMRSAITRSKNKIIEAEKDRESLLSLYRRRLGVRSSITLIGSGICISK